MNEDLLTTPFEPQFPPFLKDDADPELRKFVTNGKEVVFIAKLDNTSSIPKSPVWSTDSCYLVKIEDEEYYMGYCGPFVGKCLLEEKRRHTIAALWENKFDLNSHFIFPEHMAFEKDKDMMDGFGWIFKLPSDYEQYQLMKAYGNYSDRVRNALIITSVFRALYIRGLTLCDFSQLDIYINKESGDYFLNCTGLIRVLGTVIDEPLNQNKYLLPSTLLEQEHSEYSMEFLKYALKEKIREQLCVYEYDKTENPSFIRQILDGNSLPTPLEWLKHLITLRNQIVSLPSGREVYVDDLENAVVPVEKCLGFAVNEKQSIHYGGKIIYQVDVFSNVQDYEKIIGKIVEQNGDLYIQNMSGYQWKGYNCKTSKVSKIDDLQLYAIYEGSQIEFFDGLQKKVGKYQTLSCTQKEDYLYSMDYRLLYLWEDSMNDEGYFGEIIREAETNCLIYNHSQIIIGEKIKEFEKLASQLLCVKRELDSDYNWGNQGMSGDVRLKYSDGREYYLDDHYEILPIIREVNQFWTSLYSGNIDDRVLNLTKIICGYGSQYTNNPFDYISLSVTEETDALCWANGKYFFSFQIKKMPELSVCHIYNNIFNEGRKHFTILSEQSAFTIKSDVLDELLIKIENKITAESIKEGLYLSMTKMDGSTITNYVTKETMESVVKLISEYSNGVGKTMKVTENRADNIFV